MQYLDDSKCIKQFPTSFDRSWMCQTPILDSISDLPDGYLPEDAWDTNLSVDTESLDAVVNDPDINLCIVLTKRVKDNDPENLLGYTLYNKYMCAGNRSRDEAYETWSR